MATPARRRSTEAFLQCWRWCQARSCHRGRGGSEPAAGAQLKIRGAAQGVALLAIAGAEAGRFLFPLGVINFD